MILVAVLLVVFVQLAMGATVRPSRAPMYQWSVVVQGSTPAAAPALYPILLPGTDVTFLVQIVSRQTGNVCTSCASELHAMGGYPALNTANDLLTSRSNWTDVVAVRNSFNSTSGTWAFNATTSTTAGLAQVTVEADTFAPPVLVTNGMTEPQTISLLVTGLITGTPSAPRSSLGTLSALTSFPPSSPPTLSLSTEMAVVNGTVAVSLNEWKSTMQVTQSWSSLASSPVVCSGYTGMAVLDASLLANYAIFATSKGVVVHTISTGTSQLVLNSCVPKLVVRRHGSAVLPNCHGVMAINTSQIWTIDELGVADVVADSAGRTLAQYLGSYAAGLTIVDADFSEQACGDMAILAEINGAYSVITLHSGVWGVEFQFPTTMPIYSPSTASGLVINGTGVVFSDASITTSGTRPLTLTSIWYSQLPSKDLFVFGSAFLQSPNDGSSWALLQSYPSPTMITSFDSSSQGYRYAYLTSDNELYSGANTSPMILPLTVVPDTTIAIQYDSIDQPFLISAIPGTGLVRTDLDLTALWSSAVLAAWATANPGAHPTSACPYSSILVRGSVDPQYTRQIPRAAVAFAIGANSVASQLPKAVYLDYQQQYVWTVDVTPGVGVPLAAAQLMVHESTSSWVRVVVARKEVPLENRVVFTVTVIDKGAYPLQQFPGETAAATVLTMTMTNGQACLDLDGALPPLIVYSGCAPMYSLTVTPPTSMQCVDPDPTLPCFYYEVDYTPTFQLVDSVTGTSTNYTGPYTLQLVGGGLKRDLVTSFPDTSLASINTLTWTPSADGVPALGNGLYIYNASTNAVSWVCSGTSPCAAVFPTFPDPAEYLFQIIVSTANVTQGVSYCRLDTTYMIRPGGSCWSSPRASAAPATRAMLQVVPEPPALDGVPPVGAGLAAMMPVQQVSRPSSAARAVGLSRPGSGKGRVEMAGAPAPGAPDVMRAEKDLDKGSSTALAGASAAGAGTVPPLRAILRTRPVIPEDEEQMMGSGET
ncbi:hypothetical protein AMAG_15935 [Allomyces macrogynus ATCC 38327]|uniref:CATSPERG C-terminal domain-containing protein n=1 Tax=Allomyces macrogynus (strain ATCC 38327) TaxID=578462 RepID=A0A0L0TB38_ALLM3|nr:hypothetical protein AMAG_15935 [Allomyces macrogynus ATCC 38327]|eukprot:KNE71993.1 hypothetical protein AMAG_15935 [Allomyces macrogynus ATCC 38327]